MILRFKRSLTRREFTKRTILAFSALAASGLVGYGLYNTKKLRTINNMRRMGHCAPGVMQTLGQINNIENDSLVIYAGAMAGGIAGPGMECGVLTAPLMFMGYQNTDFTGVSEKLDLISRAQSYVNEFTAFNGSCICSRIRDEGMPACMRAVRNFHRLYSKAERNPHMLSDKQKESYSLLLEHFNKNEFHCSQSVLKHLNDGFPVTKELLDSSWLFIGGIALLNRTCGALAAGVMALGAVSAEIENSYIRVARMNRLLKNKSNEAMKDEINNFNRAINYSDELGAWFMNEFGTTSCYNIWGLNFSEIRDVERFISGQYINQCSYIGRKVAQKVKMMI
jgi:hypothetical protein